MNYVEYPFENTGFFKKTNEDNLIGPKQKNCTSLNTYEKTCNDNVIFGNEKPLTEECPQKQDILKQSPDTACTSIWNNMTKRKSLVKDY